LARIDAAFSARLPAAIKAGGLMMWPAPRAQACPVICIPTTIGTAAEVSPVGIIRDQPRTLLLVSPALRSAVAILDPDATAGLDSRTLTAGLVEPLSRVMVPGITGAALPLQDGLGAALCQILLDLGEQAARRPPDAAWRLAAALTSAQTHTAFLALGRSPFGHVLWPLASEIMTATGITKSAALQGLMPAWLAGLDTGQLDAVFGHRDRVRCIFAREPSEAAQQLAAWFRRTQATLPALAFDAGAVASEVAQRWQAGGFFLRDARAAQIRWLLSAASRPLTE
jgi:NADP-dependent alcohol dehydrogenase